MNFNIKYHDNMFYSIIAPILEIEDFTKTKNIVHHGVNRFDHLVRVSYYSYKICKIFKLDYYASARGGLLHDFFIETPKENKIATLVHHPKYALDESLKYFNLSIIEQDIIKNHMFPVTMVPPKYLESWIVDIVDNVASIYERISTTSRQLSTGLNFLFLVLLNILK